MMSKRVIELIRVSTESQAASDRASIPAQRAANRRTAQAYGLDIIRSFEIADVSGAAVLLAPEIQELLRLIADPAIHGVVTREFSRLMRPENFSDYAMLQAFADTNTILYLPEGPMDFTSKTGRLLGTIRAAIAGMERADILERVWSAKEEKRRQGKFGQAQVCLPFGVGYDEARGWHYLPEAEKVREAFRLFLAGDTSYGSIGAQVGLNDFHVRTVLRNHIYAGWRVIDQRRDPSPGARKVKAGGRQADRPKIMRAPEDVIRVRVIDEPLVTMDDFERVQQLMTLKKSRHWRTRSDYQHRFIYNGFLTCAECGKVIHTGLRRDDYYVCRGRRIDKTCQTSYMRRDRIDPSLDQLFADRLTDEGFLREMAEQLGARAESPDDVARTPRLQAELDNLQAKRERVLDAFFEAVIDAHERDARLSKIDRDLAVTSDLLLKERPAPALTVGALVQLFAPFYEFQFLSREEKRRLLSTLAPDIHVADYRVEGLYFLPPRGSEIIRRGMDSSPPQA